MGDRYPDVTIRDYGAAGNPAGRLKPIHGGDLKKGKAIIDPNSKLPCLVADTPKKSKTGKHGHAKLTSKLTMIFSGKTAQIMAPHGMHLEECVMEKMEYTYSYTEGEPEEDELITLSCMDEANNSVELGLSNKRTKVWEKVLGTIKEGEENDQEVQIIVQEGPMPNKNAGQGYDVVQLVIDAKIVTDGKEE